jgi:choline dehydrogenase-like flavoprotein
MPLDMKTSLAIFRNVHAALGLVNINLHDTRRDENWATLEPVSDSPSKLVIHYASGPRQAEQTRAAMRRVRRVLWELNCVVPPAMTHVRPMGASVHYSGLIPMSDRPAAWTTTKDGRSREFDNLYFADGTTFPFLPAKNLTFTLMANAARVADQAFGES